jgi:hypothetical protein
MMTLRKWFAVIVIASIWLALLRRPLAWLAPRLLWPLALVGAIPWDLCPQWEGKDREAAAFLIASIFWVLLLIFISLCLWLAIVGESKPNGDEDDGDDSDDEFDEDFEDEG